MSTIDDKSITQNHFMYSKRSPGVNKNDLNKIRMELKSTTDGHTV